MSPAPKPRSSIGKRRSQVSSSFTFDVVTTYRFVAGTPAPTSDVFESAAEVPEENGAATATTTIGRDQIIAANYYHNAAALEDYQLDVTRVPYEEIVTIICASFILVSVVTTAWLVGVFAGAFLWAYLGGA